MVARSLRNGSVLIVDPDAAIRKLISRVLQRAGFQTVFAASLDTPEELMAAAGFTVILRNVNEHLLMATPPEFLRRTIVLTTARPRVTPALAEAVYAVIAKPFDLEKLVQTITSCARAARQPDRSAPRRKPPARLAPPSVKIETIRHFVSSVPKLERLLTLPVSCEREAALRAAMRRTLGVLSLTFEEASDLEQSKMLSAVLHAASRVAEQLATAPTM